MCDAVPSTATTTWRRLPDNTAKMLTATSRFPSFRDCNYVDLEVIAVPLQRRRDSECPDEGFRRRR